jgi:NADPH:quinone reductase-like Zn-dependent oxidoreductase
MRTNLFGYLTTREELETYANELWDFMTKDKMDVNIHKIYPLEDIVQAHQVCKASYPQCPNSLFPCMVECTDGS